MLNKDTLRQMLNIAGLFFVIIINTLANALPINGQTTGEISDRYLTELTPAGFTFSIWGVIYVGLVAFVAYQVTPSQRENPRIQRIGYWFLISCIANCAWILLWHYELLALSVGAILTLLISLAVIFARLSQDRPTYNQVERWTVDTPFSIYLAWASIATILNIAVALKAANWSGAGIPTSDWAVTLIGIATGITLTIVTARSNLAYSATIVWALLGIIAQQGGMTAVSNFAGIAIVIILAAALMRVMADMRTDSGSVTIISNRNQQNANS